MFGRLLVLICLTASGSALAQTAPPAPVPAAPVTLPTYTPPLPPPRLLQRPLETNGIGTRWLPPASVRYIDQYQQAEQTSRCVVDAAPTGGDEFWAARPGSLPERRLLTLWTRQAAGCYAGGFRAPLPLLRGALAEASLRDRPAPVGAAPPVRMAAFMGAEAERRRGAARNDQLLAAFASCVAPLTGPQTRALLATPHGTPAERQAMERVLANGSSCIRGDWRLPRWAGTTFLRAYLAEAAYRWSRFPAAG